MELEGLIGCVALGGVIKQRSPRCLYSEVRGWLGAGAGMLVQGLCALLSESYIQQGFRAGCRGFLCRYCLDLSIAGKCGIKKGGDNDLKKLLSNFDLIKIRALP
jgi:hypothetical protein